MVFFCQGIRWKTGSIEMDVKVSSEQKEHTVVVYGDGGLISLSVDMRPDGKRSVILWRGIG